MSRVCILTESTAQFHNPVYPGCHLVHSLPLSLQLNGRSYKNLSDLKAMDFPISAVNGFYPRLQAPSSENIHPILEKLCHKHSEIIALMASPHLSPAITEIRKINHASGEKIPIRVIDSQTAAVGLGILVQKAAEAAWQNMPPNEIIRLLRKQISCIYTVFVTRSLTYLYRAGIIDPGQAFVGELFEIAPIFLLDKGQLVPIQKVRSNRHLADVLYEFVSEFDHLSHIAIIQGNHPYQSAVKTLSERIKKEFPETNLGQYPLRPGLAARFGPGCLGLVVVEKCL
jgi:DegV family protein with EDD domain